MARRKLAKKAEERMSDKRKSSQPDETQPLKRRKVKEEDHTETVTQVSKPAKKRKTSRAKKLSKQNASVSNKVKTEPGVDVQLKVESLEDKESIEKIANVKPEVKHSGYSAKENKFIGAHTSIAGHLSNAVLQAVELGSRAFGLFLKGQRQWASKPLDEKVAQEFREACKEHGFAPKYIVPHGSYLMNCASPKAETLEKSRAMLVDELQRCEKLGLDLFNFHPGSTCGEIPVEEGIQKIAESINEAHKQTSYVTVVLENMCCQGNTIGGRFEELAAIIDHVSDKMRVGICLDTCHAFAAGFNLATQDGYETMMADLERIIGLKYLKAVHVNDSKGEVGCHLDRHEEIGRGKIGLDGFRRIMNDPRFDDIPFILETPEGDWTKEIARLYKLCAT